LLMLEITGDSIEHTVIRVAVDPAFDPKAVQFDLKRADPRRMSDRAGLSIYGPTFDHTARPCRPITGTVHDQATGKALANIVVSGHAARGWWENSAHTKTDAEGKYRLLGLANVDCDVAFARADNSPYLMLTKSVIPTVGLTPAVCDMDMARGVVVTGRVADRVTGKALRGGVSYVPLAGNTEVGKLPGKDIHMLGSMSYRLDSDGRFRFVVPPSNGIVVVQAEFHSSDQKPYPQVRARAEDRGKDYFRRHEGLGETFICMDRDLPLSGWHGYQIINPKPGTESLAVDFRLDPGQTVTGRVVGPDGKAFVGTTVAGLSATFEKPTALIGDTFTAQAVVVDEHRPVAAVHAAKKLAGIADASAEAKDPPTIKLAAWGTVAGRLLDGDGKPVAGAVVYLSYGRLAAAALLHHHLTNGKGATTDGDGRFRLDAPFADAKFDLTFSHAGKFLKANRTFHDLTIKAGETRALGDVKVQKDE
jgi:hypothetical protein